MSLSALLCAHSLPMPLWSTEIVDDILFEGDSMYKKAFENHGIPDTETLSLNYLPDRAPSSPIKATTVSTCLEMNTSHSSHELPSCEAMLSNESPSCKAQQRDQSPSYKAQQRDQSPSCKAQQREMSPVMVTNASLPVVVEHTTLPSCVAKEKKY